MIDIELCEEKHRNIDNILGEHTNWLKKHDQEISEIKQDGREYKTEIKNLIKKMDDFMVTIKWGLGIFVTISLFVIGILLKTGGKL